jgi:serine phosphatase RsbU (regulator of sigma subunit)
MSRCRSDEEFSPAEERLPLVWSDASGAELARILEALAGGTSTGDDGLVVLPLPIDGAQGALCLRLDGRALPADAEMVLLSSAALVGQAVRRAQLFDRERTTAEMLQRALLPQTLPQSSSFTVAGRYVPVATGAVVGGDFYDAFALPDGRIALVIGDVVGRGVAAATIMGQIRAATRGAALSDPDPRSVMTSLDMLVEGLDDMWPASVTLGHVTDQLGRGLGGGFGGELFVTMLYGLLDPQTGDLAVASAGHPAPAVVPCQPAVAAQGDLAAPDEAAEFHGRNGSGGIRGGNGVETPGASPARLLSLEVGPPLGVGGTRRVHSATLADGELLLAFTDGLLERRTQTLDQSEQRLLDFLGTLRCDSPRSACQQVLEAMGAHGAFEDDCALLAVGRTSVEHHSATLVVPPVPEAVRPAREWARRQMEEWGIDTGPQFAVVTGLSELVTNAVLHAGTDAHVALELDGTRLTVTVSDTGSRGSPRLVDVTTAGTRGRGLSLVQTVSDAFGSYPSSAGSTVWFEVEVEPERVGADS